MKSKRKMPPHIVLPNGMWRFVKRGTTAVKKSKVRVAFSSKRKRRNVVRMARRRRMSHRRGMLGGAGMGGLAKSALMGLGAAHLSGYIPVNVPYKEEIAGAVAGYLLGGKNVKSAAAGGGAVFLSKMMGGANSALPGNY